MGARGTESSALGTWDPGVEGISGLERLESWDLSWEGCMAALTVLLWLRAEA